MPEPLFFLYSTKMNGWLTTGGSYVDDIALAATHPAWIATQRVQAHYDEASKQFRLIPVDTSIMELRK